MKQAGLCIIIILTVFLFFPLSKCQGPSNPGSKNQIKSVMDLYGHLQVTGNKILGEDGEPVALHGMSLFWSQWCSKYYNKNCLQWLRDDWKCTVVRASMAVEEGGYLTNPAQEMVKVRRVIDACIELGIYVIVDWHDHNAHKHPDAAVDFFRQIATLYGDRPNLIYEIYNEPEAVSWKDEVKPYAETVLAAIREIDPDNLITVGSPHWSQDVDVATADPIDDVNLAYVIHFYASSHKQDLRNKAITALSRGFALFATEYGIYEYTGTGKIDIEEGETWLNFMDSHKISWCKWTVRDSDGTSDDVLFEGADEKGGWSTNDLTISGRWVRDAIIERNESVFDKIEPF
ncbi:MAG: glycoside hydrolase family 5 protein [Candidatus Marinimicrobia bacterium]|nr:glycoside hydrolase family 5 protein [Candidatus Neomarinimicrobiota bacterium]